MKYDLLWRREYSLFYSAVALVSLSKWAQEELGKEVAVFGEWKEGWYSIYLEQGAIAKIKEKKEEQLQNDSAHVLQDIQNLHENGKSFVEFCKRTKVSSTTSLVEIQAFLDEFYTIFVEYGAHLFRSFFYVEFSSKVFEEIIRSSLGTDKVIDAISAYSIPSQKAALFKISDHFGVHGKETERISFLKATYPWLGYTDPFCPPHDDTWIKQFIQSFTVPPAKKKIVLGLENHPFLKLYQEILYLKDKRDDYRREAFYQIQPFLREVSRREKVSIIDLGYLLPEEFRLSLAKKEQLIALRKKGVTTEYTHGKIKIKVGLQNKKEDTLSITELKGAIGFPGKVRGVVQLIKTREDITKFKAGKVLVAITTNPEHISAMQKALAFITDEGGITCHAAIVARELGKPAVVGTKIATKVLKDGDMVEVDADKGTVRKL